METGVIVGIFTLLGTLAGVAIGASLDYLFSERGRRRERRDIAQEETMDAITELSEPLAELSYYIRKLKKVSTIPAEKEVLKIISDTLDKSRRCFVKVYKAYFKLSRYIKRGPVRESFSRLFGELKSFLDLLEKFLVEYPKSKRGQLSEQLENQIDILIKNNEEASRALWE